MKKHWYDYQWIVELTYMALVFFNILFAWLGMLFFCIPLIISVCLGYKGVLQPLLRPGAAVQPAGRALWTVPEKGHSQVNEKQKGTESTPQPCYSATRLHLFCQRKTEKPLFSLEKSGFCGGRYRT